MYSSVAEGGGRGAASGLWLEVRVCSMLTVVLGGDFRGGMTAHRAHMGGEHE